MTKLSQRVAFLASLLFLSTPSFANDDDFFDELFGDDEEVEQVSSDEAEADPAASDEQGSTNQTASSEEQADGGPVQKTEAVVDQEELDEAESPAVSSRRRPVLEEIIVTSQKREESLQDIPIAVTALSGDLMEKEDIFDLTGI